MTMEKSVGVPPKNKVALITGVNGQDGYYLSRLLLDKGYDVHGIIRRSSKMDISRKSGINHRVKLHYGDLADGHRLAEIVRQVEPDEIYNLAAQSHVRASFDIPEYTADITGTGVLRMLDAALSLKKTTGKNIKFYQASSSEMYGQVVETPQTEKTPFYPRSPYGCAKVYAHWQTVNYRESYNLFACSGILFNHETITYSTPIIVKINNKIDILPIGDVARFYTGIIFDMTGNYQEGKPLTNIEVWDKNGWTKVKYVSGYPHKEQKNPRIINARNFVYSATGSHICFMNDGSEKETKDIVVGDKVELIRLPKTNGSQNISLEMAELLGMLVGDGNLDKNRPRFTNKDKKIKDRFVNLWNATVDNPKHRFVDTVSGFTGESIGQVLCSSSDKIDFDIYTQDKSVFGHKYKKVPAIILNSNKDIMESFLVGYNRCDGLKKNPCRYKFKNFKTNSPTLASGLLYLVENVTGQKYNITVEESFAHNKRQFYYSINLLSDNISAQEKYCKVKELIGKKSQREISRITGISRCFIRKVKNGYIPSNTHKLELPNNEVKKIIEIPEYNGWFFDLETESGTFCAGIGNGYLHNSPKRGEEFVTRKITIAAARIKLGLQRKLLLGNIDAKRDWGFAGDYVEAMWMMLQHHKPDDYVISTGETHSVREFLDEVFGKYHGMDWKKYVEVDPKLYRPAEVDLLLGDSTKARTELGWKPLIGFSELAGVMAEYDYQNLLERGRGVFYR